MFKEQIAALIAATVMGLSIPSALAQSSDNEDSSQQGHGMSGMGMMGGMEMMSEMDQNGDNAISRDEYMQAHEEMFAEMDENGDGTISQDEMGCCGMGMMRGGRMMR
jgi:Ca2+-binding EF-hand superfamily protein